MNYGKKKPSLGPDSNFESNRIIITTNEALENESLFATINMNSDERMMYLNQLIRITHSDEDLKQLEDHFQTCRMEIN
jgi:hypothetical protein